MTAANAHTSEYVENLERQVAAGQEYVDMNTHLVQQEYILKQQLAECRSELELTRTELGAALGEGEALTLERDKLRVACEQVQGALRHYSFCKLRDGEWEEREPCTSEIKERIDYALSLTPEKSDGAGGEVKA